MRRQAGNSDFGKYRKYGCIAGIILLCLAAIVFTASYFRGLREQEAGFEQLRDAAATEWPLSESVSEEETEDDPPMQDDFYDIAKLRETNSDIYAWIRIPGTQVDYPVLQSETDNYYLEYNLDHTKGYPGCIYSNSCNSKDFSDLLTVLYGHNMKNGSMFGCLHEFENREFFDQNREIIVYTEERFLRYEILAATRFSDAYITEYYGVDSETGRDAFFSEVRNYVAEYEDSHLLTEYDGDQQMDDETGCLILSTCVDGHDDLRYLVIGRLAEKVDF